MPDYEKIETIRNWLGTGSINIFGLPFSGKDTQCKVLAEMLGGNTFGGGEIIRNENNMAPDNITSYTKDGLLPPSDDFLSFVLSYLNNPRYSGRPLMLSSLGRWHGEEQAVMNALKESNHPLRAVLLIKVSTNDSQKRMMVRDINDDRPDRFDDTESKLKMRFNEFKEKTIPVIEYYRSYNLLTEINGTGTREEVTSLIIDALYERVSG